ncbi:methyltransferase domain-containing protein [Streptomyces sp. WMMC897]|uniref:methyltransferase domain-containing protein n=1 Tax=Streptomyces sp. WMMC897 TaxID=3014782 RepID=UPI0022B6EB0F|nr:methyltransferase domain-containing protein [Streptomyces sp. WMMC897]MCZ7414331.1 methyltransferase domain-containing protein [Streptomyces sp. WMMC897]
MRSWTEYASALAAAVTHDGSRWRAPVQTTPRHLFVPRWWQRDDRGWVLRDGSLDEERWLHAAYADTSVITRTGALHADQGMDGDRASGRPTSSATLPSLTVRMLQHARIQDGHDLLDIGTGSGYGTALACARLGDAHVTSVDIDSYLVDAARQRLAEVGHKPVLAAVDATAELEDSYDRIVATVAVRPIPASWLRALRPGGRLVATLAGTSLLITAEKDEDGGATGRVEWDRAGFMQARRGDDYPPGVTAVMDRARTEQGDVTTGPYPVVDVANAWDLDSMLSLTVPGIEHDYTETGERRTALMAHPDGSWARAEAVGHGRPSIHQGGPRRLWDTLDELRGYWLAHGELPVRGARVFIKPTGTTILARGCWHTILA